MIDLDGKELVGAWETGSLSAAGSVNAENVYSAGCAGFGSVSTNSLYVQGGTSFSSGCCYIAADVVVGSGKSLQLGVTSLNEQELIRLKQLLQ